MAFLIALGDELPCALMQMPFTPSSGMPPYSSVLVRRRMVKSRLGQHPTGLAHRVLFHSRLSQEKIAPARLSQTFQHHVADEAVADHDIDRLVEQRSCPSTLPMKLIFAPPPAACSLLRQLVALARLRADAHQAHARIFRPNTSRE
jgi:hypothetical protein